MITVTYRGIPVRYSVFNRRADTYSLMGDGDAVIAEIKRHEYLSKPQYQTLEQRDGRHRGASEKNKRRANRVAGSTGTFDPSPGAIFTWSPPSRKGKGASIATWRSTLVLEDEKPPLKREGIVIGEIIGYRCWRIKNGLLRSVYQKDVWKPREILAGRDIGDWDSRGIHAWKDSGSKHYHEYIRSYLNRSGMFSWIITAAGAICRDDGSDSTPAMVTGTVFLWGDVVEHERGWRAEYARVRSLDWLYPDETMMGREQESLHQLRAKYGVLT